MNHTIHIPQSKKNTQRVLTIEEDSEIQLTLEDGAELELICLELAPNNTAVTIHQKNTIGANAVLNIHNITLGGASVTHDLVSHIKGEEGRSSIDWIFYGKDNEKQKLSARNIFDAPRGGGEITVHGVAEENAQTTFEGLIEITSNGGGTKTYLTEKTLMLDPTAKVDALPCLEIKTNDVEAGHCASITKVNPEDIFYFASRGITENQARQMYIEGFLGDLAQKLGDRKTKELVLEEITKKYNRE